MTALRRITAGERRARLGHRHHLAAGSRAGDVVDVARDVVALHATDPASVYVSAWARLRDAEPRHVSKALYDDRSLVRMLGMRRTLFVVPAESVAVVKAACTDAIAEREHRRMLKLLADTGIADAEPWLDELLAATLAALSAMGEAPARELSAAVPALRTKFSYAEGKRYASEITITSRVLNLLSARGAIVRGRPGDSWSNSQYRWVPAESWLPAPVEPAPDRATAQAELVRQWLQAFGPGTEADVKWWTGLGLGEVRKALASIGAAQVELEGQGTGFVLPGDDEPLEPPGPPARGLPGPWVALLPALDPTPMGWSGRDWFLGEHRAALFDRNGNIGPTVWCDGRIVGGWAQYRSTRKGDPADGAIVFRLLEDVGAEATAAVEAEATRLRAWIGDVRFTPRFTTPLERELKA